MTRGLRGLFYCEASKCVREIPDCRMIDLRVPILSSRWLGTGTVTVEVSVRLCITT